MFHDFETLIDEVRKTSSDFQLSAANTLEHIISDHADWVREGRPNFKCWSAYKYLRDYSYIMTSLERDQCREFLLESGVHLPEERLHANDALGRARESLENAPGCTLKVDLVEDVEEAIDLEVASWRAQTRQRRLPWARQSEVPPGTDGEDIEIRIAEDGALQLHHLVGERLHWTTGYAWSRLRDAVDRNSDRPLEASQCTGSRHRHLERGIEELGLSTKCAAG